MKSIYNLAKEHFIGKKLKVCTYQKTLTAPLYRWKKKSNGVTNTQFESGDPKYRVLIERVKRIGSHSIYETSEIVDVNVKYSGDEGQKALNLTLDNGKEIWIDVDTEFQLVDINTYMLK